ncbi:MAG: hypothetical protein WC565_03820 [Parcubacteria group bacterium]
MHKYYSMSFSYIGLFDIAGRESMGIEARADFVLSLAERLVESTLEQNGIEYRHQYSWPDGSLYKWTKVEESFRLETIKWPKGIRLASLTEVGERYESYTTGVTVGELFKERKSLVNDAVKGE